ncbi:response regulator transcription factor [filamentous cyanobacterium LEGE 11480]|uniref:Response regulator transcription factor n=1 Tax=Romeriopsis navalis LEGE 11480 TaxID=2777977 RepID=A0A928Z5R4_9CYAN|nr:two-component system response regulator RppA [Romeriopsis navalis]MBE9033079.1 response regulator transcription factor [Romeriopsis navalis LEGE 11480]
MHILLVDDEAEMADPLSLMLKREGYHVDVAYDGDRGEAMAQAGEYDLLILDWMMPGKSGLEICQDLRAQGNATPVLVLTAKDTIDDRVAGLDAGADDYLIKPFELRELMARVRALLRRPTAVTPSPTQNLSVDGLELDVNNQVAQRQQRMIELSEKETQLLACLMAQPHQLLTHDQIYKVVWTDNETPNSNALAAQIRLLRRKIDTADEVTLIHTVYGKGYRFGAIES